MFYFVVILALLAIVYLLWRIMDQQPDVLFRVSEIQRDIAEIRRQMQDQPGGQSAPVARQGADVSAATTQGDGSGPI